MISFNYKIRVLRTSHIMISILEGNIYIIDKLYRKQNELSELTLSSEIAN